MENEKDTSALKDGNSVSPKKDRASPSARKQQKRTVAQPPAKNNAGGRRPGERIQFSNPEIEHNFELKSQEAIRLYTRHFFTISMGIFNINNNTLRLERHGQRGASSEAQKAILAALDIPLREIDINIKAIQQMLTEAAADDEVKPVKYTAPREFTTMTRTPEASRVIAMFRRLDKAIVLLDEAFLNAIAPSDDVSDNKSRLTKLIQTFSRSISEYESGTEERLSAINKNLKSEERSGEEKNNEEIVSPDQNIQPDNSLPVQDNSQQGNAKAAENA